MEYDTGVSHQYNLECHILLKHANEGLFYFYYPTLHGHIDNMLENTSPLIHEKYFYIAFKHKHIKPKQRKNKSLCLST